MTKNAVSVISDMPLTELAVRFRQKEDTCALASMMFSVAALFRDEDYISEGVRADMECILKDGYGRLITKICDEGYEKDILEIGDVSKYLGLNGYRVISCPAARDTVLQVIRYRPVIVLNFMFPQWLEFYGSGTVNSWYSSHVICGIGIEDENLTYFEPLAGEIRKKNMHGFENIYGNKIAVIRPKGPEF